MFGSPVAEETKRRWTGDTWRRCESGGRGGVEQVLGGAWVAVQAGDTG